MKSVNRTLVSLIVITFIIYFYSVYKIIYTILNNEIIFGGIELLLKSIISLFIRIIFIVITFKYLIKYGIIVKILFAIIFPITLLNLWYGYNSYPFVSKIEIINNKSDMDLSISAGYLFDKNVNIIFKLNNKKNIILFGGGEYKYLGNNKIIISGTSNSKQIYYGIFNTYDFTKGNEIEPKIFIK